MASMFGVRAGLGVQGTPPAPGWFCRAGVAWYPKSPQPTSSSSTKSTFVFVCPWRCDTTATTRHAKDASGKAVDLDGGHQADAGVIVKGDDVACSGDDLHQTIPITGAECGEEGKRRGRWRGHGEK